MPFEPSTSVWSALLGACVLHENVEFGEVAAKHLFELEPDNVGNYVLLGKVYAAADRWSDVQDLRRVTEGRGLFSSPLKRQIFQDFSSHRIFGRMHKALNINKK